MWNELLNHSFVDNLFIIAFNFYDSTIFSQSKCVVFIVRLARYLYLNGLIGGYQINSHIVVFKIFMFILVFKSLLWQLYSLTTSYIYWFIAGLVFCRINIIMIWMRKRIGYISNFDHWYSRFHNLILNYFLYHHRRIWGICGIGRIWGIWGIFLYNLTDKLLTSSTFKFVLV